MAKQLSLAEWIAKAEKAYKKGVYTAEDMVRDWGYPKGVDSATTRMIFRSGKAGTKSREAINASKAKSNRGRTVKETYSTNLAGAERRAQDKQFRQVLDEASLFALGDKELAMMVEHGTALNVFDVVDSPDASGDPTNRYLQPVTEGIAKTDYENFLKSQGLEKDFIVMQDEITNGFRVVDAKQANTYQFASEQGKAFSNIDELKAIVSEPTLKAVGGGAKFARRASRFALPAVAGGLALSVLNQQSVRAETMDDDSVLAKTRRGLADAGVAGDSMAIAGMGLSATGAGAIVGVPLAAAGEALSMGAGIAEMATDAFVTNAAKAEEAVERGGQFEVSLGGLKFKLPELGISERLGLN